MLVTAKTDHTCSCCGGTIKKGEKCYVYLNYSKDPDKEFEVFYNCQRCIEEGICRMSK